MNELSLKAHGKINLGLDVLGRREDGYHLVRMIMQTVSVHDRVKLQKKDTNDITMSCDDAALPTGDDNLCIKAAKLLFDAYHLSGGLDISLEKRIPVAAGMAGGSTDAAAVLKGINTLYDLGLSVEQLQKHGLTLGADIPYCIMGGTALSEGIGEVLSPLSPMPQTPLLIAKPKIGVSTGAIYKALDSLESYEHPDIDGLIAAISAGDLELLCQKMGNVLAYVTEPMVPEIEKIRKIMMENGATGAMMTGSGPTVFGLFESETVMHACADVLSKTGLCETVIPGYTKETS
ncbi:MAG: 4-(cytidine 5'-diphospho)-2-C-methyl-D-erythritol kinase [Lachnospiraceae bacterium]|nr:4-(cytidine 5'-diphospho)-2-C-methyl-D-erythritol kinase [Lachnospiraceae bacterium]